MRVDAQTCDTLGQVGVQTVEALLHLPRSSLAARFAGRCVLMAGGRIVADGPTRRLFGSENLLERAGLLTQEKDGRVRRCRLEALPMKEAVEWIAQYQQFWEDQLESLANFLEETSSGEDTQPEINPIIDPLGEDTEERK